MTKKGEHHKYNKPKPRVAIYFGLAGSGAIASGALHQTVPYAIFEKQGISKLRQVAGNVAAIATDSGTAFTVAAPAAAGIVISVAADKLGLNKALAKMKAPFRI